MLKGIKKVVGEIKDCERSGYGAERVYYDTLNNCVFSVSVGGHDNYFTNDGENEKIIPIGNFWKYISMQELNHCVCRRVAEVKRQREVDFWNEKFIDETSGVFDGFKMAAVFHEFYDKEKAVYVGEADDCATVHTPFGDFETGADGIIAYFMTKNPRKRVNFNRSVYFVY